MHIGNQQGDYIDLDISPCRLLIMQANHNQQGENYGKENRSDR